MNQASASAEVLRFPLSAVRAVGYVVIVLLPLLGGVIYFGVRSDW